MFDQELEFRTDQWNAQNAQAVEQSNIAWRRKANTIGTAAQNAANQQAAQFAFNMASAEQNHVWQNLRDSAAFSHAANQSARERAMQIMSSLYGNTEMMTGNSLTQATNMGNRLERIIFQGVARDPA